MKSFLNPKMHGKSRLYSLEIRRRGTNLLFDLKWGRRLREDTNHIQRKQQPALYCYNISRLSTEYKLGYDIEKLSFIACFKPTEYDQTDNQTDGENDCRKNSNFKIISG